MRYFCTATRWREIPIDYVLLFVFLLAVYATRLDSLLFFLEIIFDVGFYLLELLLGVAEFPDE